MEDRLEFRRSRAKHLGMLLLCAGFVVGGWFMAAGGGTRDRIVGWIVVVFFGICGLAGIRDFVKGGTAFAFTRSGIVADNFDGLIPWAEIASCGVLTIHGNRMLSISFRDPDRFLVRASPAGRKLATFNEGMGWGHWAFSFAGINPGIEQALDYIRKNAPNVEIAAG